MRDFWKAWLLFVLVNIILWGGLMVIAASHAPALPSEKGQQNGQG